MVKLLGVLFQAYLRKRDEHPELPNFYRMSQPMAGYPEDAQGFLARGRFDTVTTCGNCAIVCFESKEQRARARRVLRRSGLVTEDEDGKVRVVRRLKNTR